MSEIEVCAIEYIKARRSKLIEKELRSNLIRQCLDVDELDGACPFAFAYEKHNWCARCTSAQIHHHEFRKQSKIASMALVRLEKLVNKNS